MRGSASRFSLITETSLEIAVDILPIDALQSIHAAPQANKHGAFHRDGLAARDYLSVRGTFSASDIWRVLQGTLLRSHNIFATILTAFPLGILWLSVSVNRINQNKSG
jgi:hypothetical protein